MVVVPFARIRCVCLQSQNKLGDKQTIEKKKKNKKKHGAGLVHLSTLSNATKPD